MELFEIAGEQFYFDLDGIADFVKIDENFGLTENYVDTCVNMLNN